MRRYNSAILEEAGLSWGFGVDAVVVDYAVVMMLDEELNEYWVQMERVSPLMYLK